MYDIKWIREHPEEFERGLTRRGMPDQPRKELIARILKLDEDRRAAILASEQAQARRNAASKEIGQAKAKKDEATAQKLMAEVAELKTSLPQMEQQEKYAVAALEMELAQIPNLPLDDVPDGTDAGGNVERHRLRQETRLFVQAQAAFRIGRSFGHDGFRAGGETIGCALRGAAEGTGAHGTRARAVHARSAHRRAWL